MSVPLLRVDDLHITLHGDGTTFHAVENVSFEIGRGEAFGLVGESGCGKSITALAVMGLLRRPLSLGKGRIVLDGEEIQAARILGYGDFRIMFTQVLPNILGPLIVIATLGMGGAILAEAALSFLGLGIRPPFPSWGSMLSEARDQIRAAPWLSVFPGLAIFFTVLGLNLLGDGLRDILDPQSQTRRA